MQPFAFIYGLTNICMCVCNRLIAGRFKKQVSQLKPASVSTDLSSESCLLNLARMCTNLSANDKFHAFLCNI